MKSEENFYDHYKDSFELQKCYLTKRDHYTIALLTMVVVLCIQSADTQLVNQGINSFIQKEGINITLNIKYISISIDYVFLWLLIQYYQICLTIENMYNYIAQLETKLSETGNYKIEREGIGYLRSYPWLKSFTHRIYTFLFPVLFIILAAMGVHNGITLLTHREFSLLTLLSLIAYFTNIIVSLLYLSNRWLNEEAFSRHKHPDLTFKKRLLSYLNLIK